MDTQTRNTKVKMATKTDSLFSITELLIHGWWQLICAADVRLKTERDLVKTWQNFLNAHIHDISAYSVAFAMSRTESQIDERSFRAVGQRL